MTRARDIANLVDANGDIVAGALDNVPAADVVNDTTPELGGDLSTNGNDINFGDNDKAIFGAGSDLQIYHDGSHSYIEDAGTGSIKIKVGDFRVENASGNNLIKGVGDVATLHHAGATKLATTNTGVDVTGTVAATAFTGDGSSLTGVAAFPSGTLMLFQQTAAPTGWTKQTTHNDKALRVVTGTVGSGGSSGFTTAFGTPTVTGTIAGSTGAHTLSTSQMPSHRHSITGWYSQNEAGGGYKYRDFYFYDNLSYTYYTNYEGGGGSHSHSLSASFSGGAAAINVEYVDLIIASKN